MATCFESSTTLPGSCLTVEVAKKTLPSAQTLAKF